MEAVHKLRQYFEIVPITYTYFTLSIKQQYFVLIIKYFLYIIYYFFYLRIILRNSAGALC